MNVWISRKTSMKYVIFSAVGELKVKEKPIPPVKDDKVLIKVKTCGLCGTDLLIYEGLYPVFFPYSPGHEFSGEVVDAGSEVSKFKKGDRIVVNPNFDCGTCYYCKKGLPHLCENMKNKGIKSNGGFAEYCLLPEKMVYKLPESISFEDAVFIEPLSCALHTLDEAAVQKGDIVAIIGGGTMGLLCLQLSKSAGADKVIVSELIKKKRHLAEKLGATVVCDPAVEDLPSMVKSCSSRGADVVIDNVGSQETFGDAVQSLRRNGRFVLSGLNMKAINLPLSVFDFVKNEITIKGAFLNPDTMRRAINSIQTGLINIDHLLTHELALDDIGKALDIMKSGETVKIVIRVNS
jgi:2-desacetyl-2-hydroxyethyl bacteriochlorophyllide A dehydrogenase